MDPLSSIKPKQTSKPKKKSTKANNFIEQLKELSSSLKTQGKDATVGVGKTAVDQIFGKQPLPTKPQTGELTPDSPFNFEDFLKSQERQAEFRAKQKYERRFTQETMVFHRKEEEAKLQIEAIQIELKKLAKSTQGLSTEVKKAVFTAAVEPGTYHINFFDRIRNIIEMARKQVAQSKTWFEAFNQRKKRKQAFYWQNVKKSGTKFMLSQERYMATQAG